MISRLTIEKMKAMKASGEKIACLTAYDASFAKIEDQAGIDVILVGDSLGVVVHGEETTQNVTIDDMIYHTEIVCKMSRYALIISDMPYKSYVSPKQGLKNAERLVNEGGADVIKLEGGKENYDTIVAIRQQGIPVCGHLGLTPQLIDTTAGYKVQATTVETADKLKQDALAIQKAGADCLVLECIPARLAKEVTELLDIPTIGIGAGVNCDGQILVVYDMLGITGKQFKFLKNFLVGEDSIVGAIKNYIKAVKNKTFPLSEHSYE